MCALGRHFSCRLSKEIDRKALPPFLSLVVRVFLVVIFSMEDKPSRMCCCWPFGGIHRNFLSSSCCVYHVDTTLNYTRELRVTASWPSTWTLAAHICFCVWNALAFYIPQVAPPPAQVPLYPGEEQFRSLQQKALERKSFSSILLPLFYIKRDPIHICVFWAVADNPAGVPSSVRLINQSTIQSTPDITTTTKEKMRYPFLSLCFCAAADDVINT